MATVTERSPEGWRTRVERDGHGLVEVTELSPSEQADEMLLMGLRLTEGIDLARLRSLTGRVLPAAAIDDLTRLGMVERLPVGGLTGDRIRATREGRFITSAIVADLSAALQLDGEVKSQD